MIAYRTTQLLADLVNRNESTVHKMVAAGDLPAPDAMIAQAQPVARADLAEGLPLWSHERVEHWFAHSHDTQGILVPGSELARHEIDQYQVYACPALPPGFVGLARPVLAGIRIDGVVTVYPVTSTFSDGRVGQPLDSRQRALLRRINQGRDDDEPKTVFVLDKAGWLGRFTLTAPLRQGRIVRAAFLREALQQGLVTDITRLDITPA